MKAIANEKGLLDNDQWHPCPQRYRLRRCGESPAAVEVERLVVVPHRMARDGDGRS